VEENVVAFLYWDLIWDKAGLVSLDFPWDRSRWINTSGYTRTKDFYAFKHYSAFIHPGWKRIGTTTLNETVKTAAFISADADSATFVVMNRSATESFKIRVQIPGYTIKEAMAYSTTSSSNFASANYLTDSVLNVSPRSVNTLSIRLMSTATNALENPVIPETFNVSNSPNPFSVSTTIRFETQENAEYFLEVYDISGRKAVTRQIGFYPAGSHNYTFQRQGLESGVYIYQLKSSLGKTASGRFVVAD
jgi:glucuronoarabinoxylan endo-1,4-beta-xylanase